MMTLAQRRRRILEGRAMFARGGGGAKSAKGKAGGKSSKKAKGVTQGSKGGACCKAEGGKFATGNNYGSLRGTGATKKAVARKAASAKTDSEERSLAAARVAVAKSGGGVKGAVARSKLAALEKSVIDARGADAAKHQRAEASRLKGNARARARGQEKKQAAKQVQTDRVKALGTKVAKIRADAAAKRGAAKPERDSAVGAMVAKSKEATLKAGVKKAEARIKADGDVTSVLDGTKRGRFESRAAAKEHFPEGASVVMTRTKGVEARLNVQGYGDKEGMVVVKLRYADGPNKGQQTTLGEIKQFVEADRVGGGSPRLTSKPVTKSAPKPATKPTSTPASSAATRVAPSRATPERNAKAAALKATNASNKRADAETVARKARIAAREAANPPASKRGSSAEADARWRGAGIQPQRVGGRGLKGGDVAKAQAKADAKPVTPVKPPPAKVESKSITDPVRMKAEVQVMDKAFTAAPGGGRDNFVTLADLHKSMPHLNRNEFVAVVNKGRDEGRYGLNSHEGLSRPPSKETSDAAINEGTSRLMYISRRNS